CVQARLFCVQAKASSHGPQTPTPQLSHRSVAILSPSEAGAHGARVQKKRNVITSLSESRHGRYAYYRLTDPV
ncbi:MAG: hypothetical protein IJV36_03000, partial [Prevotella sp.]|nr:hypothetical protein [Prevotella sp.]